LAPTVAIDERLRLELSRDREASTLQRAMAAVIVDSVQ